MKFKQNMNDRQIRFDVFAENQVMLVAKKGLTNQNYGNILFLDDFFRFGR
jgi:hypothetical protein